VTVPALPGHRLMPCVLDTVIPPVRAWFYCLCDTSGLHAGTGARATPDCGTYYTLYSVLSRLEHIRFSVA